MGTAFVLRTIGAAVFRDVSRAAARADVRDGRRDVSGLCWVAGSFGINYLFEQRPLRLFSSTAAITRCSTR
jgi:hypothetical protein